MDGVERPIDYHNPQGTIQFDLEPGQHWVQLFFADTPVRRWATRLSLLALLLLALAPTYIHRLGYRP